MTNFNLVDIVKNLNEFLEGKISSKELGEEWAYNGWYYYTEGGGKQKTDKESKFSQKILFNLTMDYENKYCPEDKEFPKSYIKNLLKQIESFKKRNNFTLH